MTTILKTSTKGQITLPAAWRKKHGTPNFLVKTQGSSLVLTPFDLDEIDGGHWETIFDAERDNEGEGILASDFVKLLDSIKS